MISNHRRTILFCWEYGAGLGHIAQLKTLARNFDKNRFRLILVNPNGVAVSDNDPFHEVLELPDTNILREVETAPAAGIVSYNATVKSFGFENPKLMFTRLKLWEKLFGEQAPDLIIGDYAPIALVVARHMKIPTVALGNGYTLPPTNISAYPKFTNQKDPVSGESLLATFNQALRLARISELSHLPQIFEADIQACFTVPKVDPFGKLRNPPAIGPLLKSKIPTANTNRGNKVFVYLTHCKAETHKMVLEALLAIEYPVDIYSLHSDGEGEKLAASNQVKFLDEPVSLKDICSNYQMVIHLGGHGFAMELLNAGMPQLLLPKDIEKILLGHAMRNLGLANFYRVDYERPVAELTQQILEALNEVTSNPKLAQYVAAIDRNKWHDNQLQLMQQINALI